jgi:hypothetical protein
VVLLTDGQVGDESGVLKRLQRELGEARVFTVGIDTAVNGGFLRRLAALGGGTSTLVEPGSRLEEALQAVGREIGTPLVTDLRLEGGVLEPAPSRLPDLFAGRASAAFFRFSGGRVKVTGRTADGGRFEQDVEPREAPLTAIDHLWARARIADLEDEFRASHSDAARRQIVELSIRHTVLTRLTAFVVVDGEVVNVEGTRRTVVQPVEMPAEWQMGPMAAGIGKWFKLSAPEGGAQPTRAMGRMPAVKAQASVPQRLMEQLIRRPVAEDPATPAEREQVTRALEAFLRTFTDCRDGAGSPDALERARRELLRALGETLAIATAVPLLQAFLRGAAVEIVAALAAGAAQPALFTRHARALEQARDEARAILGAGNAPAGSFWESSI